MSTIRRPRTRRLNSTPPSEFPDSSPSRPRTHKRRKMAPETPATAAPAASQLTLQDQVHAVIATLSMPDEPAGLAVAKQWANERNKMQHAHGVTAYAKVAGASWTYYVKQLAIRIGRPPDTRTALPSTPKAEDVVHIDLGPSKLVSRNHAVISYDTAGEHRWKITVLGRNGVKVDEEVFKKDTVTTLRSGSVIEIGGVQMMFVLPDTAPVVAPGFLHKARLRSYVVDEEVPFPQDLFSPKSESGLGSVAVAGAGASAQARSTAVATAAAATATTATTTMKDARSRSNTLGTGGGSAIAPVYQRGVLLELTEDMDYSQDAMKEIKPPYSYALLIAQAILTSDSEQLTLSAIYSFIMQNYSFYRHSNMGWQNSIRHNLSLNKAFRKIPRRTDEPGKGMKWELLPEHREEYIKKLHRPSNKMVGSGAGGPSSQPSSPQSPPKVFQPQPVRPIASLEDAPDMGNKRLPTGSPPRSITPPPLHSAYRVQPQEAYTPDRGSRLPALRSADKTLVDTPRPPNRGNPGLQVTMASALNTGTAPSPSQPSPFGDDDNNPAIMSAVTPAPQRQHPRLAPPSIGQLPSSYLPTSSPAPFWKYVQFESTPAKLGGDFSPMKDLHSSSPPRPGSSGRVSIRELGSPLKNRSGGFHLGGARNLPPLPVQREVVNLVDDDEDDGGLGDFPGIDLTRGFEKIGKYHLNGRVADSEAWP